MNKKGAGRSKKESNAKSPVEKELTKKLKTESKESVNMRDDEDDEDFQDDFSNSDPSETRSKFYTLVKVILLF